MRTLLRTLQKRCGGALAVFLLIPVPVFAVNASFTGNTAWTLPTGWTSAAGDNPTTGVLDVQPTATISAGTYTIQGTFVTGTGNTTPTITLASGYDISKFGSIASGGQLTVGIQATSTGNKTGVVVDPTKSNNMFGGGSSVTNTLTIENPSNNPLTKNATYTLKITFTFTGTGTVSTPSGPIRMTFQ